MRFKVGDMVRSRTKFIDLDGGTGVVTEVSRDRLCMGRENGMAKADVLTIYWSHGKSTKECELDVDLISMFRAKIK